jgi:hypothetical protein
MDGNKFKSVSIKHGVVILVHIASDSIIYFSHYLQQMAKGR